MTDTIRFAWETTPYVRGSHYCDVKGGRLLVSRARPGARTFDVKWNGRHIGVGNSIEEAKALGERLYREGLL